LAPVEVGRLASRVEQLRAATRLLRIFTLLVVALRFPNSVWANRLIFLVVVGLVGAKVLTSSISAVQVSPVKGSPVGQQAPLADHLQAVVVVARVRSVATVRLLWPVMVARVHLTVTQTQH